jgi:hypothetical protein
LCSCFIFSNKPHHTVFIAFNGNLAFHGLIPQHLVSLVWERCSYRTIKRRGIVEIFNNFEINEKSDQAMGLFKGRVPRFRRSTICFISDLMTLQQDNDQKDR